MKVKFSTIGVADMSESIKFYTEIMGLKIARQFNPYPGATITFVKGEGDTFIELIENAENRQHPGLIAVGIEVEDVKAKVEELRAKGAKIIREPTKMGAEVLAFLEDPNGVRIVLIQQA